MDEDGEREANRMALQYLAERGDGERIELQSEVPVTADTDHVPSLPVTVLEPSPTPGELGIGEITRSELEAYLDNGPHNLLINVEVEPVIDANTFRGFRIALIHETAGPVTGSGLRTGDIITAVNGTNIGRPEGFMSVWESLWNASHLDVDIIRDGRAQSLRWVIVEG
jgi:type II secretory pathway component PulC